MYPFEEEVPVASCYRRGPNPFSVTRQTVLVWKTIKVGVYQTPTEYRAALKDAGFRIPDTADWLIDDVVCAPAECEVDLVLLPLSELSDHRYLAGMNALGARLAELGLMLCPPEIGLALRLAWPVQERNLKTVHIAMEPMRDFHRQPRVFSLVSSKEDHWLRCSYGSFWKVRSRFVFLRLRS